MSASTFRVLIAILILLAFLVFGIVLYARAAPTGESFRLYEGIPLDAKLLALDKQALDEAYHNHVVKLFTVYVTDGAKQALYIKTGLGIARRAYGEASEQITKREQQLQGGDK